MGRKSSYNPKYHIPWVRSLARQGLTVVEIAKELGVAKSTLCLWVKKDKELSDALNEGRDIVDAKVEESLLKRALGCTVTERKTIMHTSADGKPPSPAKVEIVEKEIPPDTTSCIFWLKNRNPKRWRDRPMEFNDDDRPVINITVPPKVYNGD